jgi:cytochrome P450
VSSYDAVRGAALSTEQFRSGDGVFVPPNDLPAVPALEFDGDEHTRWRRLMNDLLSLSAVRRQHPMIVDVVDRQIDMFASSGTADLVKDFAHPVPGIVIGRLVGLTHEPALRSQELAEHVFGAIGDDGLDAAMGRFVEFIMPELHRRRTNPTGDFLSALASGRYHEMEVDDPTAVQILAALLGGGFHSTASGISSLIYHVISRPEIRSRVLTEPNDLKRAVDESLRITTPLQLFARTVAHETELEGVNLPAGSRCMLNYAAANRDPHTFPEPASFDIDRHPNRHLAFGIGPHLCVGQHLARAEMSIALSRLLTRLPDITLTSKPVLSGLVSGQLMRIETLPSRFTPSEEAVTSPHK